MIIRTLGAGEVAPGLWQGSRPPEGSVLANLGINVLVLCAMEVQPPAERFPGVEVLHAPNDDDFERPPTRQELGIALATARQVVQALQAQKTVLVTCFAGLNRSGLVSALTLHFLEGISGEVAIKRVRAARGFRALGNPGFKKALRTLAPKGIALPKTQGVLVLPRP